MLDEIISAFLYISICLSVSVKPKPVPAKLVGN